MSNRQDDALPELPEPWDPGVAFLTPDGVFEMPVFTADQMRSYAQSAIASLQSDIGDALRDTYVEVRCDSPRDPDWQPWQLDAVVDAVRASLADVARRNP